MLRWSDHSIANKVLVIAFALVAVYFFFIDPEDKRAGYLFATLFVAVFIYNWVDIGKAGRRIDESREHATQKQPALTAPPEYKKSIEILDGSQFVVYDIDTGDELGVLVGDQLRQLVAFHEECGMATNDFFVLAETPEVIKEHSKSDSIAETLVHWLDGRDSMEIRWVCRTP